MKRIKSLFRRLAKERRTGLIAYVTCGDPGVAETVEIALALERAGADALELGAPFSDPIADGPVIQAASQRALERGTTIADVLGIARAIRQQSDIPLIVFSYLNPILRYGIERFAGEAAEAGVDAVLFTDLPPEAAKEVRGHLHAEKLGTVFLAAPTSTDARLSKIDRASDGFVYYVSTTGVTGARRELDAELVERLESVRGKLRNPVAVGFGISEHEHYLALEGKCDAVVVGSAIVRAIAEGEASSAAARAGEVVRRILGR